MLPIYIVCHAGCEPPGYLCTYFDRRAIPYRKINLVRDGQATPALEAASALILMGGPHSVNGCHSWLEGELRMIRQALARGMPIMGVCLGAQLLSRALGAEVSRAAHMETGWHEVMVDTSGLTRQPPLALPPVIEVFEWHEDTFALPEGAIPLFRSSHLENQGYLYGKALAMQFHLEMTTHMVHEWLGRYNDCLPDPSHSVQSPAQITERLEERLARLHTVADTLYDWWLASF